jgi:hypothetical protein
MRKAVVKIASFHHFGCKPPRCGKGNAVTILIADHKGDGGINFDIFQWHQQGTAYCCHALK